MVVVPVDEQAVDFDAVSGIEARCPMCRTHTHANPDPVRHDSLQARYPKTFAARRADEGDQCDGAASVEVITVYIGNTHHILPAEEAEPDNDHEWTFFVRPSRPDIIQKVSIFLHPTFRPSRVVRQRPPFEVTGTGWGHFTIEASIILKAGYSWLSVEAQDGPDGAAKGTLKLEWALTFDAFEGTGAMGRCKLKVRKAGEEGGQVHRLRTLRPRQRNSRT